MFCSFTSSLDSVGRDRLQFSSPTHDLVAGAHAVLPGTLVGQNTGFWGTTIPTCRVLQLNLEANWQLRLSCVVECPVNCQLSEWSDWSTCSQTCGLKGKTDIGPDRPPTSTEPQCPPRSLTGSPALLRQCSEQDGDLLSQSDATVFFW